MSPMRFHFSACESLPKLAWCAVIRYRSNTVEVSHGPWVEVTDQWFCEGAWNGHFTQGDFPEDLLLGSGGKLTGDAVLFAAPSHTLERLHLLKLGDVLLIANSLPFVLQKANDALDPAYYFYRSDLCSIMDGLNRYVRSIPTLNRNRVELYYHCNLMIRPDLQVQETLRVPPVEFASFATYKVFLEESVRALSQNATDAQRRVTYTPLTTISSGYDSPATAVFARHIGCKEALTFRTARRGRPDSGKEIARALGMRIKESDQLEYAQSAGTPEAEFLASGAYGNDVIMLPWEKDLQQRLFFTGFHGDKVWDVNNPRVSPYIVRGDASGSSLSEFRLRVGFIHLPLPFLGSTSHPSIDQISQSDEMKPWRLGNDYDRPIPRRIAEEAGVDRRLFGQEKKIAAVAPFTMSLHTGEMTEVSRHDFAAFYRRHGSYTPRLILFCLRQINRLRNRRLRNKGTALVNVAVRALPQSVRPRYHSHTESLLNLWAVEKIKPRYQKSQEQLRETVR